MDKSIYFDKEIIPHNAVKYNIYYSHEYYNFKWYKQATTNTRNSYMFFIQ